MRCPQAWAVGMLLPVDSLGVIPIVQEMRRAGLFGRDNPGLRHDGPAVQSDLGGLRPDAVGADHHPLIRLRIARRLTTGIGDRLEPVRSGYRRRASGRPPGGVWLEAVWRAVVVAAGRAWTGSAFLYCLIGLIGRGSGRGL